MVCHETYKDQDNNWLSPEEIDRVNNKVVKNNPKAIVKVGPSESYQSLKKTLLILKKLLILTGGRC